MSASPRPRPVGPALIVLETRSPNPRALQWGSGCGEPTRTKHSDSSSPLRRKEVWGGGRPGTGAVLYLQCYAFRLSLPRRRALRPARNSFWFIALVILLALDHSACVAGDLDCSTGNLTTLELDAGSRSGYPSEHPSNVRFYGCGGSVQPGGEVIYTLDIPPGPWRVVTVTLLGPDPHNGDADLFLLASCDENDCIGRSATSSTLEKVTRCLEPGRRYYVVGEGGPHFVWANTVDYCFRHIEREEGLAKSGTPSSWTNIKTIFR